MFTTAQEVIAAFDGMAKQANNNCGCSYEVYIRRVSSMIDDAVAGLSPEDQAAVRAVAVETVDYATPDELAADESAMNEAGYCHHGLTEDTCPCGCFENDYPEDNGIDFIEYENIGFTRDQYIEIATLEAKIEICNMVISALDLVVGDCPEVNKHFNNLGERLACLEMRLECCY